MSDPTPIDSTAILDSITNIEPKVDPRKRPPEALTITFAGGETAILPPSTPEYPTYAAILTELTALGIPVYIKVNTAGEIVRLLIPASGNVVTLIKQGDAIGFRLDSSAQAFTFDKTLAGYESFIRVLQDAQLNRVPVLIVQNDATSEILDIRPAGKPNPLNLKPPRTVRTLVEIPTVSEERALYLFDLVRRRSCDPATPTQGCIPFLYLRDGCHVRAHEMCRLLMEQGEHPGKVWNYSNHLTVKNSNEPNCEADWSFHVAPTLHVSSGGGRFHLRVLDPSLFPAPVAVKDWRAAQGDLNSILLYTSPDPLFPPAAGDVEIDPDFSRTQQLLNVYRLQFQLRIIKLGPPPYCRDKSLKAEA